MLVEINWKKESVGLVALRQEEERKEEKSPCHSHFLLAG